MERAVCHIQGLKSRARHATLTHHDAPMQCTLLIPDLWWPHSSGVPHEPAAPHLQTLLSRSRRSNFPALGAEAWLCQAFEVERQRDWPVAALTVTIDGGDPGDDYWLRADPIHLQPRRDRLIASEAGALAITAEEAAALVATVNRHFASDGLQVIALHPQRWYVRLERDPEIVTCAPGDAAGKSSPWLPIGEQAPRWNRICTEIQMLLHDHPVNLAREARGELPVNSVWLWGGGRRTAVPGRHFTALWSEDALALALAAASDITAGAVPQDGASWLTATDNAAAGRGLHLLTFPDIGRAARGGDFSAWCQRLTTFDSTWIAPLLAALRRRRLAGIAIVAPGARGCERFDLAFRSLLRFWRGSVPLSAHVPTEGT